METMIHHHEIANKRFDTIEGDLRTIKSELADLKVEVSALHEKIDDVHNSGFQDMAALNEDILAIAQDWRTPA